MLEDAIYFLSNVTKHSTTAAQVIEPSGLQVSTVSWLSSSSSSRPDLNDNRHQYKFTMQMPNSVQFHILKKFRHGTYKTSAHYVLLLVAALKFLTSWSAATMKKRCELVSWMASQSKHSLLYAGIHRSMCCQLNDSWNAQTACVSTLRKVDYNHRYCDRLSQVMDIFERIRDIRIGSLEMPSRGWDGNCEEG